MFEDPAQFEFADVLERNWSVIRDEMVNLRTSGFIDWPEKSLYGEGWTTYGLYAFGQKQSENCARCPQTTALVERIPGLVMHEDRFSAPQSREVVQRVICRPERDRNRRRIGERHPFRNLPHAFGRHNDVRPEGASAWRKSHHPFTRGGDGAAEFVAEMRIIVRGIDAEDFHGKGGP